MWNRLWHIAVFLLLFMISLGTAYFLLLMMGIFAGASWFIIFPLGGSLLLFATCGWILLWPRVGSWLGVVFLLCISCWPVLIVFEDIGQHAFGDALIWLAVLALIAIALWFTSREALGFTRHTSSRPGVVYLSFALLVIVALPALVFLNFYSVSRPTEVREFPAGFRGGALVIWGEPNYPPLPTSRGKLIEHFGSDGLIITSTPDHAGWARDELYFYDSAGKRVKDRSLEVLVGTGQIGNTGRAMHYSEFFVGTEEQRSNRPYEETNKKLQELFQRLHPEWSN